jgi:GT2 family glycosyltransferase
VSRVRNTGATAAAGDLLAFCDSDDVVVPGWLDALVLAAQDADVVGGQLDDVTLNDPRLVAWRGALPPGQPLSRFGYLDYAPGGNCCVWRDVFEELGGWDPAYVAGSDDVDFSWRAQKSGRVVSFAPDAVCRYRYRGTLRGVCQQFFRYGRTEVRLYTRFSDELPHYSRSDLVAAWREVFRSLRHARSSSELGRALRDASYHAGHAWGSLRLRVLVP